MTEVVDRAVKDALALVDGGADGVVVENIGDAPFPRTQSGAHTIAALTVAAMAVSKAAPTLFLGINVLRNDAVSAIGIAHAVGAAFVRINVPIGATVTDQGIVQAAARDALLTRTMLGSNTRLAMDVDVKHGAPLGARPMAEVARDTWHRGGADALIVTGKATGAVLDSADLDMVTRAVQKAPIWAGSGVTPEQTRALCGKIDAAIVGTWLHVDGDLMAPLDPQRIRDIRTSLG
jgi:uncharacterized protein